VAGLDLPPIDQDPGLAPLPGGVTLSGAKGVVVILVDGLGVENLAARRGHAPTLGALPAADWVTGFPSTTVTSLATFGTGRPPGLTGLAGYSLRDPATGRRAQLINWDTPTEPETWQCEPTYFQRLAAAGTPTNLIGEERFAASSMTRCSLRGGVFSGVGQASDRVPKTVDLAKSGARLIYLYWGELDKVAHQKGWTGPDWSSALEYLDSAVKDLLNQLPAGWEVWLTADHGVVDVGKRVDLATLPHLNEGVAVAAGEPRTLHLYTTAGTDPEPVAQRWIDFLGEQAWVLTRQQATEAGLFGQVSQRALPYLGNVVVAMAGSMIIEDSRVQTASGLAMKAHHGSLTALEMRVPLLRASC